MVTIVCWKSAPIVKEGTEFVSFTKLEAAGTQAWCWFASSSCSTSVFSIVYFCDPLIQSLYLSKPYPFLNPSQILFSKAKSFSKGLGCSKEAIKVIGFQPSNTQMPRGLGRTGPVGLSSHCFFNVVSVKDGRGGNRRMEERQSGEENVEARKSSKQGAVVCHW